MAELLLARAVKADDDAVQVLHLGQLLDDAGQGLGFQLGIEARQHQRHLARRGEGHQLMGQIFRRTGAQIVQSGDIAVLMKVYHAWAPPSPSSIDPTCCGSLYSTLAVRAFRSA